LGAGPGRARSDYSGGLRESETSVGRFSYVNGDATNYLGTPGSRAAAKLARNRLQKKIWERFWI
jgi:hypothetical protein